MASHDGQFEPSNPEYDRVQTYHLPPLQRERISERDKRTYRACLHCRQRKSRCDLYGSGEPGRPPCERCIREQHDCVLGGSRRGGKRVRRNPSEATISTAGSVTPTSTKADPRSVPESVETPAYPSNNTTSDTQPASWRGYPAAPRSTPLATLEPSFTPDNDPNSTKMTVDESIASADLQNPSDALDFLAHVADHAEGRMLPPMRTIISKSPSHQTANFSAPNTSLNSSRHLSSSHDIQFPPLQKISLEMVHELLLRYERMYHPFFPLADPKAFDPSNLSTIAIAEPHMLAAICTIASKDEKAWWQIHEICSAHMQELIATLVYGGGGAVEAVEALLILAEWVPRRPGTTAPIGKGEEDHQAWMFVGMAVRIGYLLGLDRTGFRTESEPKAADFSRKRLTWSACYMMDRHISVRIGKAFWSRGPGPMTGLSARDFPSLQTRDASNDDYAAIWEANLELTQLFSNAHDVLYSSKHRSGQLNAGGEYVKYIDDFRTAIRHWDNRWGSLSCSPRLKASLTLSYEYLRLYVNAFAYQATISRIVSNASDPTSRGSTVTTPFTDLVAATPDARFIYESVEAAKALLNIFNTEVDPVLTFRYMPLRYYLYVIYSACFLYKARSTGVLGGDKDNVKSMIGETIERLQSASVCANDVGDRYGKLIRLLWRKPPTRDVSRPPTSQPNEPDSPTRSGAQQPPRVPKYEQAHFQPSLSSINTFSWLDLQGVENFATNNNSITGSMMDGLDPYEDSPVDGMYVQYDPSLMQQSQSMTWNGVSPPGIIF